MKYLNPKADLTFKKVFGQHPDLVISFLNALLPLDGPGEEITHVEYLDPELVPQNPLRKDSIVDVRCRDQRGRQFIVEMQMMWTSAYRQRVLFNASKAYVSQLPKGGDYELLQPVYSLNLVNDTFAEGADYYHDFRIVEEAETKAVIEGLRFVFVELPKFTPRRYSEKRMQVLWLRYLTEIDESTVDVPKELMEDPQISKAVGQLEESAFSEEQLLSYEKFWDIISTAKTTINSARREGLKQGREEGRQMGREEGEKAGLEKGKEMGLKEGIEMGLKEGQEAERLKNARAMKQEGIASEVIAKIIGLTAEQVRAL